MLLRCLGNSPALRIIDFFLDNPLFDYTKNEVIDGLEMGRATFFRCWRELERVGVVKVTRKIGKAKLYRLDEENEVVQKLMALDATLCKKAMEDALKSEAAQEKVTA